jgi:hypothetical protein
MQSKLKRKQNFGAPKQKLISQIIQINNIKYRYKNVPRYVISNKVATLNVNEAILTN